ncbi:4'-phosphopantetheinyl transferase [Chloropicon primus]|uniref:holo-[acyl-carrier-protein] synthase n=1 Tax=Chloropicon primus TaxID=1764295 RepID=A0A5B8MEV5_9CHLO|nr:4'-phosphopantetheinyl transferase [Chloropicon primus]UPQ98376.1 4'-phosphopantetheinyl transferase [Chloropicon primus]|mmetsp:Transcript_4452/g.13147  ORF Transcript_4452/g.13147 Transcript_4452/m.13147 type:complete len:305 (-) Transcript_4452:575-1489(-)|eukprot:QDZ19168.1 4'-phosphopantetheinyl transferase [Chloropicon primus]
MTLRWAFNRSSWRPEGEEKGAEFQFLLSCISKEEAESVLRFKFFADKQRALASRLLQRKCAEECLRLRYEDVRIKRTKGRKPFVANPVDRPADRPNFNFNVSHEGDYVVLASDPVCVVGVDVAAPGQSRKNGVFSLEQVFRNFKSSFTAAEFSNIKCLGEEGAQEDAFRRSWSCKEAFTKARGDGIGFDLQRCEFFIQDASPERLPFTHVAEVHVDGKARHDWSFSLQPLGTHWVTIARGPPSDVVDAFGEFRRTLTRTEFSAQDWRREIHSPQPGFDIVALRDLLPSDRLDEYDQIVEVDPFA